MIDIENARALVETLKDYAEHPSSFTDISPTEADAAADTISALLEERDALMNLIRDEIDENTRLRVLGGAAADEGITTMIERVIAERGSFEALWRSTMDVLEAERAERDALARDAARFDWYFGPNVLKPADFMSEYLRGVREQWTPDQWRAAIDAAMKGVSDGQG